MLQLLVLLINTACLISFGFFWAYQYRAAQSWAPIASVGSLMLAAVISAIADISYNSIEWEMGTSFLVFCSFAIGYTLGFPKRRSWWKNMIAFNAFGVIASIVYLMIAVVI